MNQPRIFKFNPFMELNDGTGHHTFTITIGQGRKPIGLLLSSEYLCDNSRWAHGNECEATIAARMARGFTAEVIMLENDGDPVILFRDDADLPLALYTGCYPCSEAVRWAEGFDFTEECSKLLGDS